MVIYMQLSCGVKTDNSTQNFFRVNWLENWVTKNNANFFKSTWINNWVIVEFELIWIGFSVYNLFIFLKMSQSDLTYMGQN